MKDSQNDTSMKPHVAVVGGTNILNLRILEDVKSLKVDTPFGKATLEVGKLKDKEILLLRRHGLKNNIPPHKINHAANFYALRLCGVKYVIGMGSVGCLREDVELPAIAVPHDYIDFFSSVTIFDDKLVHITPGFDEDLRNLLLECAECVRKRLKSFNLVRKAVYFQSRGPRLETKAEIEVIKHWADCVGMTAGSEATIAKELGLKYAAICTMDNYAHGIKGEVVKYEEIVERARKNAGVCLEIVSKAVEKLLKGGEDGNGGKEG